MKDTVHTKKAPKKAKRISSLTDVIEEGYLALFGDDIVLKEQNVFPLFALKSDPATSVCIDLHTGKLYLHTGAQYVAAEYAEMPGFLKNGGKGAGKYKHLNEKNWQDLTDKKRAQEIFEYHYPTALERIYPTDVTAPDFEAYYISAISGGVEKSVYLRSVGQDCWRVFFAKAEPGAPEFNSYSCSEYVLKEILAGNDRRTKSGKIDCCDRRLGVDEVQYLSAFMPNVHAPKRPKGKPQVQQGDISYVAYYWKGDKSIACADEAYIPGLLQALEEIARCSVILEFAEDSEEAQEPAQAEESREPVPPESAAEEVPLTEAVAPQAEQKAEEEHKAEEKAPRQSLETAEAAESTSEPELPESEPDVLQAEDAAQPEAAAAPEQAQEMPPQPEQEAAETAAAGSPAQPEEKAEKGKQGFFARFKNKKHKPAPKQQAEPEPQPEPEPELQPEAQLEEQPEKQPEEQLEEQAVAEPEEQLEEQAVEEPEEQAVEEPEEQLEEQAAEEPEEQLEEQAAEEPEEQLEEQAAEEPEEQLEEQAVEEPEEQLEEQAAEEPEEQLEEQTAEESEEQTAEKPEEQLEKQATEEQPDEQPEPQPEKQPEPQPERQPKLQPLPKRVRKAGTRAAMASGANFELPQLVSAYSASSRKKVIKKELVSALPSCPLIVPISAVNMEDNRYVYVSKQAAALCGERIVAFVLLAEKFPLLPGEENSEQRKGVMVKTVMNQSKTYIPVFSDFKTAAQVFGTKEKFGIFTLKNILNHMERNPSVAGITINPGAVKLKLTKQELEASE